MYWLKQPYKTWFNKFSALVSMCGLNLHRSALDNSVFGDAVRVSSFFLASVKDNIVVTGVNKDDFTNLMVSFSMFLKYWSSPKNRTIIFERKYVLDLLKDIDMLGAK